jgi:uroporphyrin-III C-methyltransferase
MGAREAPSIACGLLAAGRPATTPVAIVVAASLPSANIRYTTLAGLSTFAADASDAPLMLLIGPQFRARAGLRPRSAAIDDRVDRQARVSA